MRVFNIIFIMIFAIAIVKAEELFESQKLNPGDVILISLNCYECYIIESETSSNFSHSAVVVGQQDQDVLVAQSLGKLEIIKLNDFLRLRRKGTFAYIYRPKELKKLLMADLLVLQNKMIEQFEKKFKGLPFDSQYLWDNQDQMGHEKLYCSEFIAKFLELFLTDKTPVEFLSFKKNWDYWDQHFNGDVPEGKRGNSPASFSRDHRFELLLKF